MELQPFRTMDSLKLYLLKWFGISTVIAILGYDLLPIRENLELQLESSRYFFDTTLWLMLSSAGAVGLYYNSFPEFKTKNLLHLSLTILGILMASSIVQDETQANTLSQEMDFWRGRCGFIISIISVVHGSFLFRFAKQGAPCNPGQSGLWASLSASALGCFFMQVVCAYHNSLHLIIWHFVPLVVLSLLGVQIAKKFLRW